MSNFTLVDPKGWDCDLQSVYSAYMGSFQLHSTPWYDRSWGVFFESFEGFLNFSWPTITVTDTYTGRAHIVVRMSSIGAFLKMLKTRFGETLPMIENILRVTPFETSQRHLRTISDHTTYKKIHATLPAVVLAALKVRVRNGEPKAIRELWSSKDKTFLTLDFEWSERNTASCVEWGYAAVRCAHLDTSVLVLNPVLTFGARWDCAHTLIIRSSYRAGAWPPDPEPNYRRGHYIVSEYVDKVVNRIKPSFPRAYAFGESQVIPKARLPQMIQAIISSLISPDSETISNTLVLVAHGTTGDLRRLEEMRIKLPHNLLILDTMAFERQLYTTGQRGVMQEPSGRPRDEGSSLALTALLQSLGVDVQRVLHNAGNAVFMTLLGLQLLLDPETKIPTPKVPHAMTAMLRGTSRSPSMPPSIAFMPSPPVVFPPMGMVPSGSFPGGGLVPEGYQDPSANNRTSYFPNHTQRSISDHRELSPAQAVLLAQGSRLPGRTRVSSMNDLNEFGEKLGSLRVKGRLGSNLNSGTPLTSKSSTPPLPPEPTFGPGTLPHSR